MVAIFLSQRIILGKLRYSEVPEVLKSQVKNILVESGLGFLIQDEEDHN